MLSRANGTLPILSPFLLSTEQSAASDGKKRNSSGTGFLHGFYCPTIIVPFMEGCMLQMYSYVPGLSNKRLYELPAGICPESKTPLSEVAVCGAESWFAQVTVVKAFIVSVEGEKAKSFMATVFGLPAGGCAEVFPYTQPLTNITATSNKTKGIWLFIIIYRLSANIKL
jgi:hypothetical protein